MRSPLTRYGLSCAAFSFLFLVSPLRAGDGLRSAELTPAERQLLDEWHNRNDAFEKSVIRAYSTDEAFDAQLSKEVAKAAMPPSPRRPQPDVIVFNAVKVEAEAGNAAAQTELARLYEDGRGVKRDIRAAFRCWLAAARQGVVEAQHNVGIAYVCGLGVEADGTNAVYWLRKAAEKGDKLAELYANRLKEGLSASSVLAPTNYTRVYYNHLGNGVVDYARSAYTGTESGDREQILQEILTEYHKNHTYTEGIYQCLDMASDVWNTVKTKGFNANVMVGKIKGDEMRTLLDADHAWVLAEASPGRWLALECTAGQIVRPQENRRYYKGKEFSDPTQIRAYQALVEDYKVAVKKYNEAVDAYNQLVKQAQMADLYTRLLYQSDLKEKSLIVDERKRDVNEIETKLKTVLSI